MPILRPHTARFHEQRISISSVMFMSAPLCGWAWPVRWLIRPILGFWGSKVHKNVRFLALDSEEPPCKI